MDPFIELTNELNLLNQQLRMRQMANEYHQRVKNQVRNPHMNMTQVRYGGTPYWNKYNSGWQHCPSTSLNTDYTTLHTPQVQRLSLKEKLAKMEGVHAECVTSQVQFMELTRANAQIHPTPFKRLKEEMAPMATSGTQLTLEKKNNLNKRRV